MKPTIKIRTVAALRKAAANRRAVTGWSAARPDVEKPAAWVLRMPFDRVTEALERGMAIYVPKVRKGEKGVGVGGYRMLKKGEVIQDGDEFRTLAGCEWMPTNGFQHGNPLWAENVGRFRRPIGKGSK